MNGLLSRSRTYLPLVKPLAYAVACIACIACIPLVIALQAVGIGCLSSIGRAGTMPKHDATHMEQWVALGLCGVGILGGLIAIWLMRKADRSYAPAVRRSNAPHPVIRESAVVVMVVASLIGKVAGPGMVFIYGLLAAIGLYLLFM